MWEVWGRQTDVSPVWKKERVKFARKRINNNKNPVCLYDQTGFMFYKNNSTINTIIQARTETVNKLAPNQANKIATMKAIAADMGLPVAERIAGNVITASVTYGT